MKLKSIHQRPDAVLAIRELANECARCKRILAKEPIENIQTRMYYHGIIDGFRLSARRVFLFTMLYS